MFFKTNRKLRSEIQELQQDKADLYRETHDKAVEVAQCRYDYAKLRRDLAAHQVMLAEWELEGAKMLVEMAQQDRRIEYLEKVRARLILRNWGHK